jgi:RNA polymerase sigma-70 factor (ECF subfamily)
MASATVFLNNFPADPLRADPAEPAVTGDDVRAALAGLSPEHREVITEMYLNRHTAVETAEILGISVAVVTFRSYYALYALREAAG